MLVSLKKLIGLTAYTQSGSRLGKISAVHLDTDNHMVREYLIRASIFNSRVFLVKPIQVLEITDKKMIVEDAVLEEKQSEQKTTSMQALEV
jgi:sporulation protein YlmC with PRC-barrel domain